MKYTYLISWCWGSENALGTKTHVFEDTVAVVDIKLKGEHELNQVREMLRKEHLQSENDVKITILTVCLLHVEEI